MRAWMLLVLLAACGYPKTGPPPGPLTPAAIDAARVRFPAATADSLEAGRQMFLTRCNGCHAHPAIAAYSEAQWQRIMPGMASKAGLTQPEQQQVLEFVLAARAPAIAP